MCKLRYRAIRFDSGASNKNILTTIYIGKDISTISYTYKVVHS